MIQFEAKNEQVKEWFPDTYKVFLDELRNSKSSYSDKEEDKFQWVVSLGLFRTKAKTEEEQALNDEAYLSKFTLPYDERCAIDLKKLRVSISMKAGYYYRTDRIFEEETPEPIVSIFHDVMKIMMINEQMLENNPVVLKSLEGFSLEEEMKNLAETLGIEVETQQTFQEAEEETPLDVDDILDKINESGVESLTARELTFLDKMGGSKNNEE